VKLRAFLQETSPGPDDEFQKKFRKFLKKEPYIGKHGWWNSTQTCIEHLEKTNHTVIVLSNGTIKIPGDLNLIDLKLTSIAVKFSHVEGRMKLQGNQFANFEWASNLVVDDSLDLGNNRFTSLRGIEKHIKNIRRGLNLRGNKITESILGLMLTRIRDIDVGHSWGADDGQVLSVEAEKAFNILKKHRLPTVIDMDRVIDVQHELIEEGLEEFAKI